MHLCYKNFASLYQPEVEEQVALLDSTHIFDGQTLRLMEDCHAGKGCTVGTTLTFDKKIIPNIVGVDIACRVSAYSLVDDLGNELSKDNIDLERLDNVIHQYIPAGYSIRQKECYLSKQFKYDQLKCWDAIKGNEDRYRKSMGTLGGGKMYDCLRAA